MKESKETPFPSCSNHRKEVGKGASHPRDKDRAEYPQLEASVDFIFTITCCMWKPNFFEIIKLNQYLLF